MSGPLRLADGRTLNDLLSALCAGREVFAQRAAPNGQQELVRSEGWDPAAEPGPYRPLEPVKSLFFQPRERISEDNESRERVVVGVKACDLASLDVHDHVFRDNAPVDPAYASARERTILVSADCSDCLALCFCTAVGQQPYPRQGFDLNLSPAGGGWVIESGSPRGEALLASVEHLLAPASEELLAQRDAAREALTRRVAEQAAAAGLTPELDLQAGIRQTNDAFWQAYAARCVECGACNFACCTCHCFLLADGVDANGCPARTKLWDACLFQNFATVAGNHNPRGERAERLRNRFEKKFDFFTDRVGHYACDGCGRCTEVCTAGIDIRDVLSSAAESTASEGGAA